MAVQASASPGKKPQKQKPSSTPKREPLYASDYDKSKFLKWQDLGEIGSSVTLSIRDVTVEELQDEQGNKEKKPVIWFNGLPKKLADKGLALNATNRGTLSDEFGDAMLDWIGETIIVFSMMTDFRGKMVGALRVRLPTSKGKHK